MAPYIPIAVLLSFLLLVQTATIAVQAKVLVPSSSTITSAGRYLQGSVPEDFDFGYTYKYENLGAYESWPVGTLTLLEFQDGYYEGKIQSFDLSEDKSTATYVVIWSDDTTDEFVNELEWMDLMVENAKEYEPWELKT